MNKINKIFSITGLLQYFVILLTFAILSFIKLDGLLIFILSYSFFLGLFLLKNQHKKLLANNSLLIFFIFLFLYGIFNPVIEYVIYDSISSSVYYAAIIYGVSLPMYLLGTMLFKKKDYSRNYLNKVEKYSKSYSFVLIILLILLIIYKAISFYQNGMLFNPSGLKGANRAEYFNSISQLDVVVGLLITGIFIYFIYYISQLSKKLRFYLLLIFLFYVALQLSAGNRKDFMPMLIGLFWVWTNKKQIQFTIIKFLGILVGIIFFLYIGTIRSSLLRNESITNSQAIFETLTSNEFVYPFFTLSFEVEKNAHQEPTYFYGETIFVNSITIFIPRDMYPGKPVSLSKKFTKDNFGDDGIGFAYTPVTEFYQNFGNFGPAICYFIIGIILVKIQNKKNQIVNFLLFTMLIDFCRGEVSGFVYQFFFTALFLLILPSVFKIFTSKKKYNAISFR